MKIFITRQKYPFRGPIPALRIMGVLYPMSWVAEVGAYAWEAPSIPEANRLLENVHASRMFIPGLAVIDEKAVKAEAVKAPAPTPVPVAVPETKTETAPTQPTQEPEAPKVASMAKSKGKK